jgi:hypothetical protein
MVPLMKKAFVLGLSAVSLSALVVLATPRAAYAVACGNGVYRAGCVGPNGAAVVNQFPPPPKTVTCANGVYHAGCVGPDGAAVIKK